ncbi:MAG: hypothetical protein U1F48_07790 [Burkholderiales bacterium]
MTRRIAVGAQLAPMERFWRRMSRVALLAVALLAVTLVLGAVCYHLIAGLAWLPAVHQAALLLAGMGPVETQLNDAGRIFEIVYAILCGVMLIFATGLLLTPALHRLLHRYHLEDAAEP